MLTADTSLAEAKGHPGANWLRVTCASDRPVFERQIEQLRTFLENNS